MPKYPQRQPPAGWRVVYDPDVDGWYVLHGWQPQAGPYAARWYAVQVAQHHALTTHPNQTPKAPKSIPS